MSKSFKVTYIESWCIKYIHMNDDWPTVMHNLQHRVDIEQVIKIEVVPEQEGT